MGGGHEPFIDENRSEQGPEPRARSATVRAGHDADLRVQERHDDVRQIVRGDVHVTVRNDQKIMAGQRHHVHQIADFAAAASLSRINGQLQIQPGIFALQSMHDSDGRIFRIAHAEDDLEARVALLAERAQSFVQLVLGAAQRLQHRHGRVRRIAPYEMLTAT